MLFLASRIPGLLGPCHCLTEGQGLNSVQFDEFGPHTYIPGTTPEIAETQFSEFGETLQLVAVRDHS